MKNIVFFLGESGVGKTSIISLLCEFSTCFRQPVLSVTRARRADDNDRYMEYLTKEQFEDASRRNEFLVEMRDEKRFYGYKGRHIEDSGHIWLAYGSPHAVRDLNTIGRCVLIEGNSEKGLMLRGDQVEVFKERQAVNNVLSQRFYEDETFRQIMHVIVKNDFLVPPECLIPVLARQLLHSFESEERPA